MANINFYRGPKGSYVAATTHKDGLYFATDTHELLMNNVVYGVDVKLAANKTVKDATLSGTSIKITYTDGTSSNIAIPQVQVIDNLTSSSTTAALSANQGKVLSQKIDSTISSVYRVKGTKSTIAEVLALSDAKIGDVWNVTAEFTLSSKKYPAGTNVVCTEDTTAATGNDTKWDALGGTIDLSPYLKTATAASTYVAKSDIVNNLTAGGTTKVLSAEQGKALKTELDDLTSTTAGIEETLTEAVGQVQSGLRSHTEDKNNPHGTNVSNILMTGYVKGTGYTSLSSSEKLNTAIGKLEAGIVDLIKNTGGIEGIESKVDEHIADKNNPHQTNGSNVLLTGYTKGTKAAISASDSTNSAIGKLEYKVDDLITTTASLEEEFTASLGNLENMLKWHDVE